MDSNDFLLIENIKKRDYAAFSTLYDRYNLEILKKIQYRINDIDQAEDILQNLWMRIWENPDFLRTNSDGTVAGYLYSYVHFQVLNYFRNILPEVNSIDSSVLEISDTEYFEILDKNSVEIIFKMIENLVAAMSVTDQKIYDLRIKQNLSVAATAKALNLKEKTVRNGLSNVLSRVRSELDGNYELSKSIVFIFYYLEIYNG